MQRVCNLTYWVCVAKSGNANESIRELTRKAALDKRTALGEDKYHLPTKGNVPYVNSFDLFIKCMSGQVAEQIPAEPAPAAAQPVAA